MKFFLLLLGAVTFVRSVPVVQEPPVFRSVIGNLVKCQTNSDLTLCIKEHALKAAERLSSVPELTLYDGITLLNDSPRESRSLEPLSTDVEERKKQVGERLWDTVSYLMDNSAIELSYGLEDEDEEEEEEESREIGDVVEGRGKMKKKMKKKGMKKGMKKAMKKMKMLMPLGMLLKAKLMLLLAFGLKKFAICLIKLVMLVKVFLIMKIFGMMGNLLSKGGGGGGLSSILSKFKGEGGGLGGGLGGLGGGLGGLGGDFGGSGGDSYASAAGSSGWDGDHAVGGGYDSAQGGPYARLGKDGNDMAYAAQFH